MKRFLSLLLTLTLVLTLVGLSGAAVQAVDPVYPETNCTTSKTLYVHYHKWDETYADTTIWAWGYGTNGSGAGNGVYAEDGFGAVYEICIDDADAGDNVGLINKYSAAWGDGFTDRDAVDTDMNGSKDGNHNIKEVLRVGADKVCLNTAVIKDPELIRKASRKFGSSTIVVASKIFTIGFSLKFKIAALIASSFIFPWTIEI